MQAAEECVPPKSGQIGLVPRRFDDAEEVFARFFSL